MADQKELRDNFRQQQERFVYYLIALSVACIGYSVYTTNGQPLKWSQIPLGVSVLSWGASIYCGLKFLKYSITTLYNNLDYFEIVEGRFPGVGTDPILIERAKKIARTSIEANIKTASRYSIWHERLFYIGVILFVGGHVLNMYSVTK